MSFLISSSLICIFCKDTRTTTIYVKSTCTKSPSSSFSSEGSRKLTVRTCFSSSCAFKFAFSVSNSAIRAFATASTSCAALSATEEKKTQDNKSMKRRSAGSSHNKPVYVVRNSLCKTINDIFRPLAVMPMLVR